jgi:hypothetical protein
LAAAAACSARTWRQNGGQKVVKKWSNGDQTVFDADLAPKRWSKAAVKSGGKAVVKSGGRTAVKRRSKQRSKSGQNSGRCVVEKAVKERSKQRSMSGQKRSGQKSNGPAAEKGGQRSGPPPHLGLGRRLRLLGRLRRLGLRPAPVGGIYT